MREREMEASAAAWQNLGKATEFGGQGFFHASLVLLCSLFPMHDAILSFLGFSLFISLLPAPGPRQGKCLPLPMLTAVEEAGKKR